MSMINTFQITGTALSAQSIHMDVIARNMANAQLVSSSEQGAYRARRPEFAAILSNSLSSLGTQGPMAGLRPCGDRSFCCHRVDCSWVVLHIYRNSGKERPQGLTLRG